MLATILIVSSIIFNVDLAYIDLDHDFTMEPYGSKRVLIEVLELHPKEEVKKLSSLYISILF